MREQISEVCQDLTGEARSETKAHQTSIDTLATRASKLSEGFVAISGAKTFRMPKAPKLLNDSEKLHRDIETTSNGAPTAELVRQKVINKEVTQIWVGLVDKPQAPEYDKFRRAICDEFLSTTLEVLNDHLHIEVYEDIKRLSNVGKNRTAEFSQARLATQLYVGA